MLVDFHRILPPHTLLALSAGHFSQEKIPATSDTYALGET